MTPDVPARRGIWARLGVTALNILAPGLGLLRVQQWRAGALFLAAPFLLLPIATFAMGHFPISGKTSVIAALAVIFGALALIVIASAVVTWRNSAERRPATGLSRWYFLAAIAMAMPFASALAVKVAHSFYKPFYLPGASMAPTISRNDRIVVDTRWRGPLVRGEIVLFRHHGHDWIKRIAALPGDRIAMRGGVPYINGVPATQEAHGERMVEVYGEPMQVKVYREKLPGERTAHLVSDTGQTPFDDTAEISIPAGHIFVLGDNRDHSADSRVSPIENGSGLVPITATFGRPLYISWSSEDAKIGARLDR